MSFSIFSMDSAIAYPIIGADEATVNQRQIFVLDGSDVVIQKNHGAEAIIAYCLSRLQGHHYAELIFAEKQHLALAYTRHWRKRVDSIDDVFSKERVTGYQLQFDEKKDDMLFFEFKNGSQITTIESCLPRKNTRI